MVVTPEPSRRLTRSVARSNPSGSEYTGGGSSPHSSHNASHMDQEEQQEPQYTTSQRGRKRMVKSYKEDDTSDLGNEDEDDAPRRSTRSRNNKDALHGFIASDESSGETHAATTRAKSASIAPKLKSGTLSRTRTRRSARQRMEDEGYEELADGDADADGSFEEDVDPDAPQTSPSPDPEPIQEDHEEGDDDGKAYHLRKRRIVNYAIPPPLEDIPNAPINGKGRDRGKSRPKPRWNTTGAELSRMLNLPLPQSDSESDVPTRTPRKPPFGAGSSSIGGGMFANGSAAGVMPEFGVGTPSNLGKVGEATLADADPLGVNPNVTFDSVGGLDDHITALKEMTLLPLLYPELFQRFNLTPPRGVLFHGPPGTGKTLLARALASSCRSGGRTISFFMRKGADVLSKWVGEAERQLRILFEEAKACQPSIIFFDEIDGLAPVRSSRQDQIHASIVATLLALMDGMDGRGQVVVIGATNRPDAVDPALRRPGRFDREFYFPLPNMAARAKILNILTKDWAGWEGERGDKARTGLAKLTKGYGGADLRALCTEAALNAVQRRYPQIYQSEERLLVKPETVHVQPKDFLISIKKLVPSSARSSSSVATPLPAQLVPLLGDALASLREAVDRVVPVEKKRTALEEAEYEEEPNDENSLEREEFLQSLDTLRVYRPRIILCGPRGMGQGYVATALLHQLEGFHLQSLDLGSLLGDSARTAEAAIVQLFTEAKRNRPSVIFIPSLTAWCSAVSESARITIQLMLDSLSPNDPVLLLAVADSPFSSLPSDVKLWFGQLQENRFTLQSPTDQQRAAFFHELILTARHPPTKFPDAVKRKRRILEKLPVAPPVAPKPPTAVELAQQEQKDEQTITMLKFRLGPVLMELKKKFKRFSKAALDEYGIEAFNDASQYGIVVPPTNNQPEVPATVPPVDPNGVPAIIETPIPLTNGTVNGMETEHVAVPRRPERPKIFNIDLERIQKYLYRGKYLTPQEFLEDLAKIVYNATVYGNDNDRSVKAQMMYTTAQVFINEFDTHFKLECDRMAVRERKRREQYARDNPRRLARGNAEPCIQQNGESAHPISTMRRSARHNGQEPELSITDPLKLERRLKRQRSSDPSPSQDETGRDDVRSSKKARMSSEEGDAGPLDVVDPTSPPNKSGATVHFAQETTVVSPSPPVPMIHTTSVMESMSDSSLGGPNVPYDGSGATGNTQDILSHPSVTSTGMDQSMEVQHTTSVVDSVQSLAEGESLGPPPMEVESEVQVEEPVLLRSPSPEPHPPFEVPEEHLHQFSEELITLTSSFNVEQLEQLRAACLGCIWRRRSEWNRGDMVLELATILRTFLQESREADISDN